MKLVAAGRGWWLAAVTLGLALGALGSSMAVTPVDGQGLVQPVLRGGARSVAVTAPGFLVGPGEASARWSEGCLRDPAGAERLRQLHLNTVRPLALALGASVEARYPERVSEWTVCQ